VWDLSADDPTVTARVLLGHQGRIKCLALSSDGRTVVTGSFDHTARVWDLDAQSLVTKGEAIAGRRFSDEERARYALGQASTVPVPAPQFPVSLVRPPDPAWHARQAAEAKACNVLYAAAFHLRALAALERDNDSARKRYAAALAQLPADVAAGLEAVPVPGAAVPVQERQPPR
jgi:hypothetical protein